MGRSRIAPLLLFLLLLFPVAAVECDVEDSSCITLGSCTTDGDCPAGYYCENKTLFECVKCPSTPESPGYLSGICSSQSCVGYDPDCCITDADCSRKEEITGAKQYCLSGTCFSCSGARDLFCPSQSCVGYDPDCCITDADCSTGFSCISGTCIKNYTMPCITDADCSTGFVCSAGRCVMEDFLIPFAYPSTIDLNSPSIFLFSVRNILDTPAFVTVRVSAKNGVVKPKEENFTVPAFGEKQLAVWFYPTATGDAAITVEAEMFNLTASKTLEFTVSPSTPTEVKVAPTLPWFIYIAAIGVILWRKSMEKNL